MSSLLICIEFSPINIVVRSVHNTKWTVLVFDCFPVLCIPPSSLNEPPSWELVTNLLRIKQCRRYFVINYLNCSMVDMLR